MILLRATAVAARRAKLNRSALIREALRAHLKKLDTRELELRDRKGYEAGPSTRPRDSVLPANRSLTLAAPHGATTVREWFPASVS
jgi:hypothetical protein